jgi:predicted esterase
MNRRNFGAITGGAVASLALNACRGTWAGRNDGRLSARPTADKPSNSSPPLGSATVGRQISLGLDRDRDAILQLPKTSAQAPLPLLVFLHGATQTAEDMFWYLDSAPDETGVAILAPNARDTTWDAITGSFGPDVQFLNNALQRVFNMAAIDTARVAIGGFSDGATYALSLGLINGDLFTRVAAFSPGFVIDGDLHGKPNFYISHGTRDQILPIDRCGRRISADLKSRGYQVTFREFDGRHEIPKDVMLEGLRWVSEPRAVATGIRIKGINIADPPDR